METIVIHPLDKAQSDALLTFLNDSHIPFEKEYADETERIMSNPWLLEKLEESRKEMKAGKGTTIALEDLWK